MRPLPAGGGDAAGEEMDAELGGPAPGRGQARAVERLGLGEQPLAAGEEVPLLRQGDEVRAVGRRGADETLGGGDVPGPVVARIQLYGCYSQDFLSADLFSERLTDQSIGHGSV